MAKTAPDPTFTLRGLSHPVTSLCYTTPENNTTGLVSGTLDGSISIWDLKSRRRVQSWAAHAGHSILWLDHYDKSTLISQGRDGAVRIWTADESGYQKTGDVQTHSLGFCNGAVAHINGSQALVLPAADQASLSIVSIETKETLLTLTPDSLSRTKKCGMCMCICGIENQSMLLAGYENGMLVLWDLRTGKILSHSAAHNEAVMALHYNSSAGRGISGSVDNILSCWTLSSQNSEIVHLREQAVTNPGISCIKFRTDGKLVATGGWDHRVRLFSAKKTSPLAVLTYHTESIQCLAFAADNALAVGSKDCTISLWDLYR